MPKDTRSYGRRAACAATALALMLAGPAAAQTTLPAPTLPRVEGVVTIGGALNDNTGALERASEFDVLPQGALGRLAGRLWRDQGTLRFDAEALYGGTARDQHYLGELTYGRWLTLHVKYLRFPRRLDHDPLAYVDAASGIGGTFVVRHTDYDPASRYDLTRSQWEGSIELAPPAAPALRVFASHRQEGHEGMRQSLTTSHCPTCHVVSYGRRVDQSFRDLSAGLRFAASRVGLEYRYLDRRFTEHAPPLTNVYDRGVHPATLADVFLNRLQYDARAGALPFDVTPASSKHSHLLTARVSLPGDGSASGSFTRSHVTNRDTNVGYTFTGGTGRFVAPIGRALVIRGTARRYTIEADDVFVDVVEQVAPAGPTAGLTYAQAYPSFGPADFLRRSALGRTPTDLAVDLTWTPTRGTTLQVGYAWEEIQRRAFEVETTTTGTLTIRARSRPWKPLETRTRFQYDRVTDPFANARAAVPAVLQPFPSPNNLPFTGLQYYEMYESRQADLTAFPTRSAQFDESIVWSPAPRVSVNAHYRLNSSRNDQLTFSSWSRVAHTHGAEVWIAPGDRWSVTAGYTAGRERLETLFSTLAFVG